MRGWPLLMTGDGMSIIGWIRGRFNTAPSPLAAEAPVQEAALVMPPPVEASVYKDGECGSPFIRWIVAQWVSKGPDGVGGYKADLDELIAFTEYKAGDERLPRPQYSESAPWPPAERNMVKAYLDSSPQGSLTLSDWMLVVDYLYQRYCPEQVMRADAEMLAVRQVVRDRVRINYADMVAGRIHEMPPVDQKLIDLQNARRQTERKLGQIIGKPNQTALALAATIDASVKI